MLVMRLTLYLNVIGDKLFMQKIRKLCSAERHALAVPDGLFHETILTSADLLAGFKKSVAI